MLLVVVFDVLMLVTVAGVVVDGVVVEEASVVVVY